MSEYFDMEALDDSGDDEYFDMEALDGTSFHLRVKNIVDLSASLFSGAITVFFVRSSVQGCWGDLSILCVLGLGFVWVATRVEGLIMVILYI